MNKSFFDELIKRKRKRKDSWPDDEKKDASPKKFKSAETKKTIDIKLIEPIQFMASLDKKYESKIFEEKYTGENLNFNYRKDEANKKIKSIKEDDIDELISINESLKYNNTNKNAIYRLLKYYHDKNNQIDFNEAIAKYKFCITKNLNITDDISVNLNSFFKITESIEELEELSGHQKNEVNIIDLRNSLVDIFTSYYYIADYVRVIRYILSEEDLTKILSVKYINSQKNNNLYELFYDKEQKIDILKAYKKIKVEEAEEFLDKIEFFLCRYFFNFQFIFFKPNQPVNYDNNLTLYYNYVIFSLYELSLEIDELEQILTFKKSELYKYSTLRYYHELLFDKFFDKELPVNKTMDQLLQYLFLLLSNNKTEYLDFITKHIHLNKEENFLDKKSAILFQKKLNKEYTFINAKIVQDKILFDENGNISYDKIEIKYKNYPENISNLVSLDWIWESHDFETFQETNFFLERDLNYLKYLIKHILLSKLFRDIYEKFNNVSSLVDYYFNEANIDDYINRIIFLPFKAENLSKYAITDRRTLSVLVSGFPEKSINNLIDYRIYRILELALRSVILAVHEPYHFIKSAYSLLTEGIVSRHTSNNDTKESGFIFEEILFGWIVDKEKPLDLKQLGLNENIKCENSSLECKKIDMITALQLLNPDIYDKDLTHFRKCIFGVTKIDLKSFSFSSIKNPEYKTYLQSVIDEKSINNLYNKNAYSINAGMNTADNTCIEYIQYNHNLDIIFN